MVLTCSGLVDAGSMCDNLGVDINEGERVVELVEEAGGVEDVEEGKSKWAVSGYIL